MKPYHPLIKQLREQTRSSELNQLITAYEQQINEIQKASAAHLNQAQLNERSALLTQWMALISEQIIITSPQSTMDLTAYQKAIAELKTLYTDPFYTSAQLGLEASSKLHTTDQAQQIDAWLHTTTITQKVQQTALKKFPIKSLRKNITLFFTYFQHFNLPQTTTEKTITDFIEQTCTTLYQIGRSGFKDCLTPMIILSENMLSKLTANYANEVYNEIKQSIIQHAQWRYRDEDSVFAIKNEIKDFYCYKGKPTLSNITLNNPNTQAVKASIQDSTQGIILNKLQTNLSFVCQFRGHKTAYTTQKFSTHISAILSQTITQQQKSQSIKVVSSP